MILATSAQAQTDRKEALRQKQTILKDEIELANKILSETKKKGAVTTEALQTISQKIKMREALLRNLNREVAMVEDQIKNEEKEIDKLSEEVEKLKAEYAEMIRHARRTNNKKNHLAFVLASQSFNQAMRRMEYLKQLSKHRQKQVEEITRRQTQLQEKIEALKSSKKEKELLLAAKTNEYKSLESERTEQQQLVTALKGKEKELQKEIAQKQQEAKNVEREIQRIIAVELRKAREAAEREALEKEAEKVGLTKGKDFTARTTNKALSALVDEKKKSLNIKEDKPAPAYDLTPEARALAASFAANKGKLPWPVERGIITGGFGKQRHPINKALEIDRPFIEISTQKNADARACFEGEVAAVVRIPGANKSVMVRHGNYFTVYTNLIDVYVNKGDKVTVKQPIGKIFEDETNGKTILQFGIWMNSTVQNPAPWLAN